MPREDQSSGGCCHMLVLYCLADSCCLLLLLITRRVHDTMRLIKKRFGGGHASNFFTHVRAGRVLRARHNSICTIKPNVIHVRDIKEARPRNRRFIACTVLIVLRWLADGGGVMFTYSYDAMYVPLGVPGPREAKTLLWCWSVLAWEQNHPIVLGPVYGGSSRSPTKAAYRTCPGRRAGGVPKKSPWRSPLQNYMAVWI